MNLSNITNKVTDLCKEVGSFILEEKKDLNHSKIYFKGVTDLVSDIDIASEKRLIKGLNNILNDADVLAEESRSEYIPKGLYWVIDPIDGTTNFVHGIPLFAISIALMQDDNILLGVVYEINQNEMFSAWKNGPALLNNKAIHVRKNNNLIESLMATGFPYDQEMDLESYIAMMTHIVKNTRGIRRLGSAAIDLAYVAAGRLDGFYEIKLNPWDVAAGALIVKCAGGEVYDFKGKNDYVFGKSIIAGNKLASEYLLKLAKKY